jgi:hypothetical protein
VSLNVEENLYSRLRILLAGFRFHSSLSVCKAGPQVISLDTRSQTPECGMVDFGIAAERGTFVAEIIQKIHRLYHERPITGRFWTSCGHASSC